jgi:hypothetical protein
MVPGEITKVVQEGATIDFIIAGEMIKIAEERAENDLKAIDEMVEIAEERAKKDFTKKPFNFYLDPIQERQE